MNSKQYALGWLNRGAYETALTAFEKLVEAAPDDYYLHRLLVFAAFKSDDLRWERCNGFYERTFNRPRDRWLRQYIDALQQYHDAQYKSGIERLYGIITEIDNSSVWHAMGECLKMQDAEPESCKSFQEALKRDPLYLPAIAALADLFFEEGRFDRLEQYWEIIKISEKALGNEYYHGGRMVERIRSLAECATTVRNALITVQHKDKQTQLLSVWQQWIQYPDNIPLLYVLIYMFYETGRLPTADICLKTFPDISRGTLEYGLGLIGLYCDKQSEAYNHFNEAIEANLKHPLCWLSLADSIVKQELHGTASWYYRKVYERYPWCLPARIGLAEEAIRNEDWLNAVHFTEVSKEDIAFALLYIPEAKAQWTQLERLALKALVKMDQEAAVKRSLNVANEIQADPGLAVQRSIILANAQYVKKGREILESIADQLPDGLDCSDDELILLSRSSGPNRSGYGVTLTRAFVYLGKGKKQKALAVFKRLAHRFPERSSIYRIIGQFYDITVNQPAEAEVAFRHAVSLRRPDKMAIINCVTIFLERCDLAGLFWLADKMPTNIFVQKKLLVLSTKECLAERKQVARKLLEWDPQCEEAIWFLLQNKSADDPALNPTLQQRFFYLDPCNFTLHFKMAKDLMASDGYRQVNETMEYLFKRGGRNDAMLLRYAIGFAI
jgi:tetratricopeptide (TPR) repeat protein